MIELECLYKYCCSICPESFETCPIIKNLKAKGILTCEDCFNLQMMEMDNNPWNDKPFCSYFEEDLDEWNYKTKDSARCEGFENKKWV